MDCSKKRCKHETAAMTGHSSDPAWCPIDLDDRGCRPGHCKHFEPKTKTIIECFRDLRNALYVL